MVLFNTLLSANTGQYMNEGQVLAMVAQSSEFESMMSREVSARALPLRRRCRHSPRPGLRA